MMKARFEMRSFAHFKTDSKHTETKEVAAMGKYRLIVTTEALPGRGEDYSEWCRVQHFPDIMRVPGIASAQRFKLAGGADEPARFMAIFELDTDRPLDVLAEFGKRNGTPDMPSGDCFDRSSVKVQIAELEGEWSAA
jgi:hypothetical protein